MGEWEYAGCWPRSGAGPPLCRSHTGSGGQEEKLESSFNFKLLLQYYDRPLLLPNPVLGAVDPERVTLQIGCQLSVVFEVLWSHGAHQALVVQVVAKPLRNRGLNVDGTILNMLWNYTG